MKKVQINKTFLIYFIVILAFVVLRIASSFGAFNFIKNQTILSIVTTVLIQICLLFLLPLFLIKILQKNKLKESFKNYKYSRLNFKCILYSFGLGILACILNFFIAFIFSTILNILGYDGLRSLTSSSYSYNTVLKFIIGVVCVAVLPAFCEEFLHRGVLLNDIQKHLGYKRAILISSLLFGLMHLNVNQVFYAIILGLIMGYVAVASNNIWPAVIMHFTNNFINVYLDFASAKNLPLGNMGELVFDLFSKNAGLGFLLAILVICFVVFGMLFLVALLFKETRYKALEKEFYNLSNDIQSVGKNGEIVTPEEAKIGFDIYYNQRFKNISSFLDLMIPSSDNDKKKLSFKNYIFLIATLVLSVLITCFTFLWGAF